MSDVRESVRPRTARSASLAACFTILFAAGAAAQAMQPTIAPAPSSPEFMSRYDFRLSIAKLLPSDDGVPNPQQLPVDERFAWDSHFGGSFDFVDFIAARMGVVVDYQAVMGNERQPFDPNQGNYTMEGFVSGRVAPNTEVAGIFHHVSRHLSDRPKNFAVAYNEVGARVMHRLAVGSTSLDAEVEGGRTIQHSYVDYTWLGEAQLTVRRPVGDRTSVFVHGTGQVYLVNDTVANRGAQEGAMVEAGVRVHGRAGNLEVFAGYEKRVDADPIDRLSQRWGLVGFRLLSR